MKKYIGLLAGFLMLAPQAFAATKLMGSNEGLTPDVNMAPNTINYCSKFTSSAGTIDQLHYYDVYGGIGSYDIAYGLYSDAGAQPGSLIASVMYHETPGSGWKTGSFPSTAVSAGNYWFCHYIASGFALAFNSGEGSRVYAAPGQPFQSTYPTPLETLTNGSVMIGAYQSAATTPTPTPTGGGSTPTPTPTGSVLGAAYGMDAGVESAATGVLSSQVAAIFHVILVGIGIIGAVMVTLFGLKWLIGFVRSHMHK